ncbi:P-loop containing nucleoside triphosphate hydrolase protein [Chytriomyces sp. MP71]|nr:P-loop containing nucleoside triphosphate hydrolase protein [Chytriomyces sp. MP71]
MAMIGRFARRFLTGTPPRLVRQSSTSSVSSDGSGGARNGAGAESSGVLHLDEVGFSRPRMQLGSSFVSIGATSRITANLQTEFGVIRPTPMQTALFPAVLSHRDVVLKDETGSGKSFGLLAAILSKKSPAVPDTVDAARVRKMRYVATIYVAPTPELALQLFSWATALLRGIDAKDMHKHVQVLVPQSLKSLEEQHVLLADAQPSLLIGTPRRLLDAIAPGLSITKRDENAENVEAPRVDISRLQTLVLDEADALVRVPTRFETNRDKMNRISHPLYSETLVTHILQVRRPDTLGGTHNKRLRDVPLPKPQPASLTRAHLYATNPRNQQRRGSAIDPAAARRLQVVLCSATINNPVRKELERMRGWIVDPILMDVNGAQGAPRTVTHVCLVVGEGGRGCRNLWSKEQQDAVYAKLVESAARTSGGAAVAAATVDPVWAHKIKYPALADDDARMIALVADLCAQEGVSRGILFLNSNISCARVVERLRALGLPAARISEDIEVQAASNVGGGSTLTYDVAAAEASLAAKKVGAVQSGLFFQTDHKLMVVSEHSARGLDLPDVSHVFMVGPPSSPASYLHMSGRVGRMGKEGKAFLILGGERYERKTSDMYALLKISPAECSYASELNKK